MSTVLKFEKIPMKVSKWNKTASVPFISQIDILQNSLKSDLDKDDDIQVGYGTINTIYPYTQQNVYTRELKVEDIEVVRLENDFIKAIFIPSLGGRLWSLYDKVNQRDLLYVNDVIRPSNLATRNAWVSGGVEWNIGIIGHSPLTCEQLFVGSLEVMGMPVLRMYEYERIRKVTYQMDFFLPEDSRFLLCRMRVVNPNKETVPMYWWSNMAVPELEKGRLVVEADAAYTSSEGKVYKVHIPQVDDVDISYPKRIPKTVDYFFDIPENKRKYITQLDENGYGMVQTSTNRLQSRKLFVWGQRNGSQRWQDYLTEGAGNYIEIQAGLAKTQYGCIPMPKESEWEWIEAYGAIKIDEKLVNGDWQVLRKEVNQVLNLTLPETYLEKMLQETRNTIALKEAVLEKEGSMFGAIENYRRKMEGEGCLSENLLFGSIGDENEWLRLMVHKTLGEHDVNEAPESYMMEECYYLLLQEAVKDKDSDNWYTWYHLGLNHLVRNNIAEAIAVLNHSLALNQSAFTYHALGAAYSHTAEKDLAITNSLKAMEYRKDDIGLTKDCMGILMQEEAYETILEVYGTLSKEVRDNPRIQIYKAYAYAKCGYVKEAEAIVKGETFIEVEDIREGECFTSELWELIQEQKEQKEPLPFALDFRANI